MTTSNQTPLAPPVTEVSVELSTMQSIIKHIEDRIFITPVCEFFGIDAKNQTQFIKNDQILGNLVGKNSSKLLFNDNYLRVWLPKKGFIRWIQLINPNIVRPELREKFIQFQSAVFDFLYGAAETLQSETALYKELKELEQQRATVTTRIRQVKNHLELHWHQRYGQQQLQFTDATQQKAPSLS